MNPPISRQLTKKNMKLDEYDLLKLKDLREICIEEDLLDLQSYDSISRADKISNAWDALDVIERITKKSNNK